MLFVLVIEAGHTIHFGVSLLSLHVSIQRLLSTLKKSLNWCLRMCYDQLRPLTVHGHGPWQQCKMTLR